MRMAEMPPAQSGLLAVAEKFTGEPYCPLMGDVTVTTGVVANAGIVSTASPHSATWKEKPGSFTDTSERMSDNKVCKPSIGAGAC
jgi:hypothetical protein